MRIKISKLRLERFSLVMIIATSLLFFDNLHGLSELVQERPAPAGTVSITLEEFLTRYRIVGESGFPLRKLSIFEGKWVQSESKSKPDLNPIRFRLESVDGKRIQNSKVFYPSSVRISNKSGELLSFTENVSVRFRGYEDLSRLPPPEGYFEFTDTYSSSPRQQDATQLIGVLDPK